MKPLTPPRATLAALLVTLIAAAQVVQAVPAAAVGAFGPAQEIHRPCTPIDGIVEVEGDLAASSDGVVRGFVSSNGTADCEGSEIWYVERRNGRWSKRLSPYTGTVLAVAADSTGTYLLHSLPFGAGLRITKRSAAGVFTGGRPLSGGTVTQGDVVASGGTWWAVWAEATTAPPNPTADLFQAKTIGPDVLTKRNITNSPTVNDLEPSLVLRPESQTSMVWELSDQTFTTRRLGIGTAGSGGTWRVRPFELTPEDRNVMVGNARLAFAGGITHIVWVQERGFDTPEVVTANNLAGWRTVKVFNTRGNRPRIAMSSGKVFEAWNTLPVPTKAFVAERSAAAGAAWTGTTVSPEGTSSHRVLAVAAVGGKATVLVWDGTRLYARTQP